MIGAARPADGIATRPRSSADSGIDTGFGTGAGAFVSVLR
jgi:hypothetical protein